MKNLHPIFALLFCVTLAHACATEIQGCTIFPADNPWNQDVSNLPVHANSDNYIATILTGSNKFLHPDFGSNPAYGIPFVVVNGSQAKVPINIVDYKDESDPGPFPIPLNAPIENGGDKHVIALDKDNAVLYELFNATQKGAGFDCSCSAKFDLKSNALRTDGFTSADAAGLPILPGLARYDEVTSGVITHALRFTVRATQAAYIHPATHKASSETSPNFPPMGLRLRLKKDFDLSKFTGHSLVILTALKKYGMFVADNGSDWYISGGTDARWNDDDLNQLKAVPGSAFEAVETGPILGTSNNGGSGGGTTGGNTGGTGGKTASIDSPRLKIVLDYKKSHNDTVTLTGTLNLTGSAAGNMSVDIGGVTANFTLNAGGKGSASQGTVSLKTSKSGTAKLQINLKGSFGTNFADEGLTATTQPISTTITAKVTVGGVDYSADIPVNYAVAKGKGTAGN